MPTVSPHANTPHTSSVERRSFYRVNDAVALKAHKLEPELVGAAKDRVARREFELQAIAGKGDSNANFQAALRDVEIKSPEVANLFRLFESRIDSLVKMVATQEQGVLDAPNVVASVSGSGVAFDWTTAFYEGEHVLVEMTLFPARYNVEAVAKVVRGNPNDRSSDGKFHCALEFVAIAETDREVLLQHIHSLQIESLRSRNDQDY